MSEQTCPTCGPTTVEQHPRQPVTRCANCKEWLTSVPPAQPPAAPESDVSTPRPWPENAWPTAAELADWLSRCTSDERLSYADHSLATAQRAARCVDQQHAARLADLSAARERLRVVEGERDHWKDHAEEAGRGFERVCLDYNRVAAARTSATARAESAEAAHCALHAAVEALWLDLNADADYLVTKGSIGHRLRALLAGGAS